MHLYHSAQAMGTVQQPLRAAGGGASAGGGAGSPATPSSQPHPSPSHSSSCGSSQPQPSTLFSNAHTRGEVATQVGVASRCGQQVNGATQVGMASGCGLVCVVLMVVWVCFQVLISSHDLAEGFGIAREIIIVSLCTIMSFSSH